MENPSDPPEEETPAPPPPLRLRRLDWLLFVLIVLLGIALRAPRLNFPAGIYFDEKYYVSAANDYLDNRDDDNSVHPPLAKIQIAAVMLVMDVAKLHGLHAMPDVVAWRTASLLAGILSILLVFRLALTLTRKPSVAHFSAFLVATDFLQIVESRITKLDEIQAAWILLGFVWCADYRFKERRTLHLWGAAVAFGCATACKWNGLFAAAAGFLTVLPAYRPSRWLVHALKVAVIFAVTIPTLYAAAYTPYGIRHGLSQKTVQSIYKQHKRMWDFRYDQKQFTHRYISKFYQWPLVSRPIWYFYEEKANVTRGIVAFGNILFWWFSFFLLFDSLARSPRDPVCLFLASAYFPQWLLWASSTTGGFIYYMTPVIPFMAIAMGRQLQAWLHDPETRPFGVLVSLALVASILVYYPFLVGWPVSTSFFHRVFFLPTWI